MELLEKTGRALFGSRWQSEVARILDVDSRTVRRWLEGTRTPAPGVYHELLWHVVHRQDELDKLEGPLKIAASGQ